MRRCRLSPSSISYVIIQAFLRYGDAENVAWFGYAKLASDLGPNVATWTVRRAMIAAESAGILEVEEQFQQSGAQVNRFTLHRRF
jgi:hypothetical protein